jgi:2-polyprenyl-3-methyl-5-hydroxy-6-metoxy-1,4-benzoquinol methylase
VKQLTNSPISNVSLKPYLRCKDYTVSKEVFKILIDEETELLITSPRPDDVNLSKYYESDDYISHSNSHKSVFTKIYQIVRNYTLRQKIKLINSFGSKEKTLLDIGAGTGEFLFECHKDGWKVEGIEPNMNARKLAEEKTGTKLKTQISELGTERYDVITMWHVLEHVPNLTEYVSQLNDLLNSNGTIIVAVPNHKSFDASYYGKFWAAYDVPRHLWHFSQTSIQKLFARENMKVNQILPMKFDAFYVSLLSEKYKKGKMNILKAFNIGWRSNLKAKHTSEYSSLIYVIRKA